MRIGELARRTDCPVETIRYYERAGVLPPPARTDANYRAYGSGHVDRLRFIRHCRSLDMTLDEVAVLPAGPMRQFAWAGTAPVLDPLPRWVRADVFSTGDLTIAGATIPGEGGHARRVQELLMAGAPPDQLADAGVGWVVAQIGSRGEIGSAARTLAGLPVVYRDGEIAVYRAGGDSVGASPAQRRLAVGAHLVWLAVLVGGAAGLIATRFRPSTLR